MSENGTDSQALLAEFWKEFEQGCLIVLATSQDDQVTARTVSAVRVGGEIVFATFVNSVKYTQIGKNSRVALCAGATQVIGMARIAGGLDGNPAALAALLAAFPDDVERIRDMPEVEVVAVTPVTGGFARMDSGEAYSIDFATGTVTPSAG